MLTFFKLFLVASASFLALDFLWLNVFAKKFYFQNMQEVAHIQDGQIQINLVPGLLVYVLLALGIVHFILPLLNSEQNYFSVFLAGSYFGLIVYGVYDLTNAATLKSWPLALIVVDTLWGAFATGLATVITTFAKKLL